MRDAVFHTLHLSRFTFHASRFTCSSFVKAEVYEVVVLHNVLLELQALFARAFRLGLTAGLDEIREAGDLGADETFLDVRMDSARRFPGGRAFANRPRAVLLAADRQEGDVA